MPDKPIRVHIELQQPNDDDAEARQGLERATRLLENIAGNGRVQVERAPARPPDAKAPDVEMIADVVATIINAALLVELVKALVAWVGRRRRTATIAVGDQRLEVNNREDQQERTARFLSKLKVKGPVPKPPPPARQRHALLITTSEYEDPKLPTLRGAENDGQELAAVLQSESVGGYLVQRLHNPAARAAKRAIKQFLRAGTPEGLAVVYFSGHGIKHGQRDLYLATTDTEVDDLEASAINAQLIADEAAGVRPDSAGHTDPEDLFGQVVVILDCCYGGAFPKGAHPKVAEPMDRPLQSLTDRNRKGFVLLSAASATEFAFQTDGDQEVVGDGFAGWSLFTRAVLEGIADGRADTNGDGEVTADELFDYARARLDEQEAPSGPSLFQVRTGDRIVITRNPRQAGHTSLPAHIEELLTHPDETEREKSSNQLLAYARRGPDKRELAVQTLKELLADPAQVVRSRAGSALSELALAPEVSPSGTTRRPRGPGGRRRAPPLLLAAAVVSLAIVASLFLYPGPLSGGDGPPVEGTIIAAGSSTVEPVVQAVARELGEQTGGNAGVNLSGAGTVDGIAQFCRAQEAATAVDVVNASRLMNAAERQACRAAGVAFEEFVIGFDGISVVVANGSDLDLDSVTLDELRQIFGTPGAATWDQVREGLPEDPVVTCAPDGGSGTHDAFSELALGGGELRPPAGEDVRSADDNELVQCVQTHPTAIGFFGHAYYEENQARLRLLSVSTEDHDDAVGTSHATVAGGIYPLSRPLLVYVRTDSLRDKPQVAEFTRLLLTRAEQVVLATGYTPTSRVVYTEQLDHLDGLLE